MAIRAALCINCVLIGDEGILSLSCKHIILQGCLCASSTGQEYWRVLCLPALVNADSKVEGER